ncbi:MAG TPA: Hsp20/alpha crystallin family protein [Thermoguttaceae bacterium]|nr:Hsp20/alpha crystallin family protein [Thermoguttaceae bacterium]
MTALFRWPSGWDPTGTLRHMQREMDRLMGRDLFAESRSIGGGTYPPVNVLNGPEDILVQCEVAGVERADLDVSITGETLVIRGSKKPPADAGKARFHRRERGFGDFNRTVVLPDKVDPGAVEAELHAGILSIRLPKSEAARPRQIEVK